MAEMTNTLKIQANIQGFSKDAGITLFAALSLDNGVVVVARDSKITTVPQDGFYVITSIKGDERRDLFFGVEDIQQAISAYIEMHSRGLMVIKDSVQRFNPESKYDHDGFDEKGPRYRLAPDIGSGHVAVMAIALVAKRQIESKAVSAGADDMMEAYAEVGLFPSGGRAVIMDSDMPSWI